MVENADLEISIVALEMGQSMAIHVGEIISVDGVMTAEVATVDQQFLTGEARPVDKSVGESVVRQHAPR